MKSNEIKCNNILDRNSNKVTVAFEFSQHSDSRYFSAE